MFQTYLVCGSLLRTRISIQLCVENTFGLWFRVGVQASVYSPLIKHVWIVVPCCIRASFQTCVDCGSLFANTHQSPALCFKRLDYGSVSVYKHLLRPPLIKHVWIGAPCCAQASVSTRVSNTFCGSWSVYIISLQPFVSNTFDFGFLFVYPPAHTKLRVAEKILHRARAPKPLSNFFEKEPLFENWFDFDDGEHLVDQIFQ